MTEKTYDTILKDLSNLRDDCLWDAYPEHQGALIGCPREVIAFAKQRILDLEKKNQALKNMLDKVVEMRSM